MPISAPARSVTGRRLTLWARSRRAAATTRSSGWTLTTGVVITCAAVVAAALAVAVARSAASSVVSNRGGRWCCGTASLRTKSVSETMPTTRLASSTTGTALIR